MKNRYRAFLRNTSNKDATGRNMISLPKEVWKEMGWSINENLQIDIIRQGVTANITITKDTDTYENNK
tara:strand:- start:267 stop:470 length:204 start_codon:yes stop_codon:yes gene_type:complete